TRRQPVLTITGDGRTWYDKNNRFRQPGDGIDGKVGMPSSWSWYNYNGVLQLGDLENCTSPVVGNRPGEQGWMLLCVEEKGVSGGGGFSPEQQGRNGG
ncbi:MAG: hypothetical protein QGG40_10850, partial [Myxococcota bacterium]|nr:hypothetical protein [Myxococcota bacterium]